MQETKEMMNKDQMLTVPYVVIESIADRHMRTNKRLWVLCILLIVLLVGTNAMWIWYESQFSYVETEITQESENGVNNFIGNDGEINNGTTDNKNKTEGS